MLVEPATSDGLQILTMSPPLLEHFNMQYGKVDESENSMAGCMHAAGLKFVQEPT